MKNTRFFLSVLIIIFTLNLSAQEKKEYDFRTSPIGNKLQSEVGKDFRYVAFVIKGIKTPAQKQVLKKFLRKNPNFKRVSINTVNEFHGFINKKLSAQDVREILLSQGLDFRFDRYKFKGCYLNEQFEQNHLKK